MIDIFGLNGYMRYFCTRFPRDGKPCNWHSDRNGVRTLTFFFPFALIPTKNAAVEKKFEKNFRNIWRLCDKVLTFAPAFRKECNRRLTCWLRNRFAKNSFLFFFYLPFAKRDDEKKKKEKKTSEIIWSICLKVLTFASAFWKENQFKKEAIFEEFT